MDFCRWWEKMFKIQMIIGSHYQIRSSIHANGYTLSIDLLLGEKSFFFLFISTRGEFERRKERKKRSTSLPHKSFFYISIYLLLLFLNEKPFADTAPGVYRETPELFVLVMECDGTRNTDGAGQFRGQPNLDIGTGGLLRRSFLLLSRWHKST